MAEVLVNDFDKIFNLLKKAQRPLILIGNGVYISQAVPVFRDLIDQCQLPCVSSLPALGALPSDHPLSFSFVGHTGEFFANLALFYSDLLLALGVRLDLRQTGSEIKDFKTNKKVVRVDIDKGELDFSRIEGDINIQMDLKEFLSRFSEYLKGKKESFSYQNWLAKIKGWEKELNSSRFYQGKALNMYQVIKAVDDITKNRQVVVSSGVGTHQQLVARCFSFDYPRRIWLTSAGHGTMGFDIPVNIGAMLESKPNTLGIVFVGDGSFQMMNWKRDPSTGNKHNPSFSAIAKAYGLKGYDISSSEKIVPILKEVFADDSPALVHCKVDYNEDVLPMLMGGQKLNEMYPFEEVPL